MGFKPQGHNERAEAAALAKKAQLDNFRSKFGPNDPNFAARQAERLAVAQARDVREAEREAHKAKERAERAQREEQDRVTREAAEEVARVEAEKHALEEADRLVAEAAAAKADRDARYAARKARGVKRGPKK